MPRKVVTDVSAVKLEEKKGNTLVGQKLIDKESAATGVVRIEN